MKKDKARKWTERKLAEIEKGIHDFYEEATPEIEEEWLDYMQEPDDLKRLHGDFVKASKDDKKETKEYYKQALFMFLTLNSSFKRMVGNTTLRLTRVNQEAINRVNGALPGIYAKNFDQVNPSAIQYMNVIRSSHTIQDLIQDIVTGRQIDFVRDMTWNSRQINAAVLEGILRGESIPEISARVFPLVSNQRVGIVDRNRNAAIRTARTLVTGAENRGRYDRYQEYEDDGLVVHKIWIATPDGRTRAWHLDMDGQEVPVDEPFIDGHGNELEYPGDESAEPETVYNCRCSMKSVLVGVRDRYGRVNEVKRFSEMSLHDRQITEERARRAGVQMNPLED